MIDGVNDDGTIVASGKTLSGASRAFRLTPIPIGGTIQLWNATITAILPDLLSLRLRLLLAMALLSVRQGAEQYDQGQNDLSAELFRVAQNRLRRYRDV